MQAMEPAVALEESELAMALALEPAVQGMVMAKELAGALASALALDLAWELELVPLAPIAHFPPTVSLGNQTTDRLPDCEALQSVSR